MTPTPMPPTINDLDSASTARLIIDFFHRLVLHHGLWFAEVKHQLGAENALKALENASQRSIGIQLKRLSKVLGFELEAGLPKALMSMPLERQRELLDTLAVNWLATDGVWFQTVEFAHGMNDAKRCNDSCWGQFSPLEASRIKTFLELPEEPGLDGLAQALEYRLYARVNQQKIVRESPTCLLFYMEDCRVQSARKRKGLDDYPCKSGGLVEYTYFARSIDPRIHTQCVACPPDEHPDTWFCGWRFTLDEPAV